MPCLNEAETLEKCIRKALAGIEKEKVRGEIIVADNGSVDGSIEIAARLGARVVHVKEKGYGSALRGGIEGARGKWIIMGDSDDSYDFSEIGGFIRELRNGAEMVMGCRLPQGGGTIHPGAMPWKNRWIGNPSLSFIGRLFFGCPVTDFHCGLRAFTKTAYQTIDPRTTGMEFASELVIKGTLRKMRITEVPISLHKDGRSRPPHLKPWRDGWRHLRFMLLFSPRWLFFWPGLCLMLFGSLMGIPLAIHPIHLGSIVLDTNTLLIAGLMVATGLQVLYFGAFVRRYATAHGLLPETRSLRLLLSIFSLERGIIAGAILLAGSLAFLLMAFLKWKGAGFGGLSYPESLRLVIPTVILGLMGVQTVFSSFLLSILDLKHR